MARPTRLAASERLSWWNETWTLAVVFGLASVPWTYGFVVGLCMFLASLHEFVPLLSFAPGAFFGFATMFSAHAAHATAFGVAGPGGETLAALASMLIGALVGLGADELSGRLS